MNEIPNPYFASMSCHLITKPTVMYRSTLFSALFIGAMLFAAASASAQNYPTNDPVIRAMWEQGMQQSQTRELAHQLIDVVGPRLTGTESLSQAQEWLMDTYAAWGIQVDREQIGTWNGWRSGLFHVDMIEPRIAPIEAELLAWSHGTDGVVTAPVVLPPTLDEDLAAWWQKAAGAFVLASAPEIMCRAPQELEANARPETVESINAERDSLRREWSQRAARIREYADALSNRNPNHFAGILSSRWSGGWGVNKVFSASGDPVAQFDIGCEDYGLLVRLAEGGNTPVLRVDADAEFTGEVPLFNVIGRIPGTELPNEYVLLGAHVDSWHAGTGATDNGTGTITMLEAMRIIKETYPNPRRTIIVGHWTSEEQGLIGSGAFREDHPEIMEGMQAAFNQDNGTWRFEILEGQGFLASAVHLPKWMAAVPTEISKGIDVQVPGEQNNAGSDHTSFICAEIPSFRFQSPYDEYRQYTWHTNRDTYDKIVFDDLAQNATLAAMIAYMASEDPVRFDRTLANLPNDPRTGEPRAWRSCRPARRSAN